VRERGKTGRENVLRGESPLSFRTQGNGGKKKEREPFSEISRKKRKKNVGSFMAEGERRRLRQLVSNNLEKLNIEKAHFLPKPL